MSFICFRSGVVVCRPSSPFEFARLFSAVQRSLKATCSQEAPIAMLSATVLSFLSSLARRFFLALTLAALFFGVSAFAQNTNGRVIGTVTDSQGAAVAGAKVTVTNVGTNVHWSTVTDGAGTYQVLDVPIGMYLVRVEAAGFKKTVTDAQELTINQSLHVNVRLNVGAITETVQRLIFSSFDTRKKYTGWSGDCYPTTMRPTTLFKIFS